MGLLSGKFVNALYKSAIKRVPVGHNNTLHFMGLFGSESMKLVYNSNTVEQN